MVGEGVEVGRDGVFVDSARVVEDEGGAEVHEVGDWKKESQKRRVKRKMKGMHNHSRR